MVQKSALLSRRSSGKEMAHCMNGVYLEEQCAGQKREKRWSIGENLQDLVLHKAAHE